MSIIGVAIILKGKVYSKLQGRHCDVIKDMVKKDVNPKSKFAVQGFITDSNTFLTREQAAKYALRIGQIKEIPRQKFTSEELW